METQFGLKPCRKRLRSESVCDLPQIAYIFDADLLREANKLPNIVGRPTVVHNLIEAYDLLRNVIVYPSNAASEQELCTFHSSDYIDFLKEINSLYTPEDEVELNFGLGYDCPPLDGIFDYCCAIAGSTLTAARALIKKEVEIAVNWFGGWHHAQRQEAEGFCYVNDVVLGILEMRKVFNQILYIDLDVHHGNGVEACFEFTQKVFTLSLHQFEPGFYPGTGDIIDVGCGNGRYYTMNIPLKEGITDANYIGIFDRVLRLILKRYSVDAVVIQCGADGLSGDPLGGFNLSELSFGHCLKEILAIQKPTLVLGGGGYNIPNTARCWAYLTSVIIGCDLGVDIPEHEEFSLYGPSYELCVTKSNRKDLNSEEFKRKLFESVEKNLMML